MLGLLSIKQCLALLLFLCTTLHAVYDFTPLDTFIQTSIKEHVFPGGVFLIYYQGKTIYHKAFGHYTYDKTSIPITKKTLFDSASLTKVIATTTLAMILYDQQRLDLEDYVADFIKDFPHKTIKIKHLLNHTSGIKETLIGDSSPPPYSLWQDMLAYPIDAQPGTKFRYTCTDMILLQKVIEKIVQRPFEEIFYQYVTKPLNMNDTVFNPSNTQQCAPTRAETWRGKTIQGRVNDDRAFILGGACGNAGIFTTAKDLKKFMRMLLNDGRMSNGDVYINDSTIKTWLQSQVPLSSARQWGYGWEIGRHFGTHSYGHYGWTGTSLWADKKRDLLCIILTNRTYPDDNNFTIRIWRTTFHNLIEKLLDKREEYYG